MVVAVRPPIAGALLVIAVIAGCSTIQPSAGPSRLGGTWTAVSVPGIVITHRLEAPRVQFTVDGRIQGATNCTEFRAPFRLEGDRLILGPFDPSPQIVCTDRDRQIDAAFASALTQAVTVSGGAPADRLTLSGPGGEIVLAQPAAQPEP